MPTTSHILTLPAVIPGKVERTLAIEASSEINTSCSWWARVLLTVNYVFITVLPLKIKFMIRNNNFIL